MSTLATELLLRNRSKGIHPVQRSRRGGIAKWKSMYAPGVSGMSEGCVVDKRVIQLSRLLASRLSRNLEKRLKDDRKRTNWVWQFFRRNPPRVAAMLIMSRHAGDDLDSFSDDDYFLNTSLVFQPATNSEAKLLGELYLPQLAEVIWLCQLRRY